MPEPSRLRSHNPHCYVCGKDNPCSAGAVYTRVGDRVHATLHLDRRHEGAPGFVHGGALSAVLDDTLGSLLWILERPAVTARLEVDFRRRAHIDTDYTAEAWCERIDGRKLHLLAVVRDPAGEVVAEARSLFVEVSPEQFKRGNRHDLPW